MLISLNVYHATVDALLARADALSALIMERARAMAADRDARDVRDAARLAERAYLPHALVESYAARLLTRVRVAVA